MRRAPAGFSVKLGMASKLAGKPTGGCENGDTVQSPELGSFSQVSEEEKEECEKGGGRFGSLIFTRERDVTSFISSLMWTRELIGLRDRFQSRKCTVVQNNDKGGKGYDISFSLFPFLPPRAPQRSIVCELYKLGKAP